ENGFFGVGVYKIANADGVAPALSGPFYLDDNGADVLTGVSITKILIDPLDHNVVFVATINGTGGRGDDLPATIPSRGLFRSTNFMGASPVFTKLAVTTANNGDRRVTDIIFEPGNPNRLIANVGGDVSTTTPDGGLYLSTNALDASPTFTQTLAISGFMNVKFAIYKSGAT